MINLLNYTTLEKLTMFILNGADHFEEMPTMCFASLVESTNIPAKQLRGVLSSLIQKGAVQEGEYPNGTESYSLTVDLGI